MPKPRLLGLLLLSVLAANFLAGCITSLAPVQALPREALADVTEVSVAVGPGGIKHYAWTECFGELSEYTCVLVYSRVAAGAVLYSYGFVQQIGEFARFPDVAVNSAGDTFVVWSECEDVFTCVDYWTVFPATNPESVEPQAELIHSSEVLSENQPVVEARGLDVYAAYYLDVSGFTRLRYRQLNGGSSTGYIDSSTLNPVSVNLAVDTNGDLHAVWVRDPITPTTSTYVAYANNIASGGNFNAATTFDLGIDALVTAPDLALDDDDRAYYAYSIDTPAADSIWVRCRDSAANCYRGVTTLSVPLVSGNWNVYDDVHLEMIGDQPNVVFAATNDAELYSEVWWYHPPDLPEANAAPSQVTDTDPVNEGEPLIVEENSEVGDVPVIGWRQYQNFILDAQGPAGNPGHCEGDVFFTYATTSNTRQVFTDRGTCGNYGLDLAANGAWVAGVFIDEDPDVPSAHAAWTAFNAYVSYVPVVTK